MSKEELELIDANLSDPNFLEYLRIYEPLLNLTPMSNVEDIGDRLFALNNGKVIFAAVITELPDSFIVAYPASLVSTDGIVDGKPMTLTPTMRLLKSGVTALSEVDEVHRYYYLRYLARMGPGLPQVFTSEKMRYINEYVSTAEKNDPDKKASKSPKTQVESGEEIEVQGYTFGYPTSKARH